MKKSISIISAIAQNDKLLLQAAEKIMGLIPSGQILVDSDHFSFIYIMEEQIDYTYIVLPEAIWPFLKMALEQKLPLYIGYGDDQIELEGFHEEMENLIANIKGNSNYGNDMVTKVEAIF
ncbi:hypothetical protein [Neobacillus muris]|uniref:UPF0738 family protein n=1 Tax=Neobacillus muris TaxID=2941334 RepID=UPI00204171B5|nr:hypothetical protein [Neobacillus muris]